MEISDIDRELGMESKMDVIDKDTKYNILVPFRESYNFSTNCILCGSPNAENGYAVQDSFKSGEYLVAQKNTTLKFDGLRICTPCKTKSKFTAKEWIILAISILLGAAVFALLLFFKVFFCVGCIAWIIVSFIALVIGFVISKSKVEGPPAKLRVILEDKTVGRIRPTGVVFKFRSKRAADEFAAMNGGEEVELKNDRPI